jgi:SPP1 family predicted phage head-tail adaptor
MLEAVDIGRLRHLVTIQQRSSGLATSGQPNGAWSTVATVWGSVEDLRGDEFTAAQQVPGGKVSVRVRIRYRAGVLRQMRVIHGSRTLEIEAPLDPDGRRVLLELMCKEVT